MTDFIFLGELFKGTVHPKHDNSLINWKLLSSLEHKIKYLLQNVKAAIFNAMKVNSDQFFLWIINYISVFSSHKLSYGFWRLQKCVLKLKRSYLWCFYVFFFTLLNSKAQKAKHFLLCFMQGRMILGWVNYDSIFICTLRCTAPLMLSVVSAGVCLLNK